MLKKIFLALGLSIISSSAWAVCGAIPLTIKDASNATQNISSATAADGNCKTYIDADTSSQMHTDITAPPTLGSASGGLSKKRLSALSTTVTAIKTSAAGQLYMLHCANSAASGSAFIQVFDVATAAGVTLGTTVPDLSFEITAGSSSGFVESLVGVQFANGIQIAATTTATGSSALATLPNCNAAFN